MPPAGGEPPRPPRVDKTEGGGDDGGMEARLKALEDANLETRDRLARIETRMDSFATKEDVAQVRTALHQEINAQTWKFITWTTTIGIALIGATFTIAKLVH